MEHIRMLDKLSMPTFDQMTEYCGDCSQLFSALNEFLTSELSTNTDIRFPYGNKYGWSVCHRVKTKLICDIFPESGAFTVMIRLPNTKYALVYNDVSDYTRKCIDNKYPCGDGGWLHYRVTNVDNLNDIEKLLTVKVK